VSIEIFSDLQCPHCKLLYEETLRPLVDEYVSKGKVYLIHHDLALPMHAHAREAACYATAALTVNKYEQVCAALFRTQESWGATGKIDEVVAAVLSPSEMKKVREAVKSPEVDAQLKQDFELAQKAKVQQTPTMVITHGIRTYPIPGAISYAILKRFIDQLLSN
jgi:protein-disulfide isomerase